MARQGSKVLSFTPYDRLEFSWEVVRQSIMDNSTDIKWALYLISGAYGAISATGYKNCTVIIDGNRHEIQNTVSIENNKGRLLAHGTETIPHREDGAKSFTYSFSQEFSTTFSGAYIGTVGLNDSGALPDIPRASRPSCITRTEHTPNVGDFGQTITIYTNVASPAFTHTVRYTFGSQSGTIATGVYSSTEWTIPLSLMDLIPHEDAGSGTIFVDSYVDGTLIGTRQCAFTAHVPDHVVPTCQVSLTDVGGGFDTYGAFVCGISRFGVVVSYEEAYRSPIRSHVTTIEAPINSSYSQVIRQFDGRIFSFDADFSGTLDLKTVVRDSRGRTGSASRSITVLPYTKPHIRKLETRRCNADGVTDIYGEYVKVTFSARVTELGQKNTAAYQLAYKKSKDEVYTTVALPALENVYDVADHAYIFQADTGSSYDVEVTVSDNHDQGTRRSSVSTAFTIIHLGADGTCMGLGKVVEKSGYLEIGFQVEVEKPIEYVDSGKKLLTLTPAFTCYNGAEGNTPWCRKNAAGMVELWGIVSPASDENVIGTTPVIMFNLPVGYRPGKYFYESFRVRNGGGGTWLLTLDPSGEVWASEYMVGTSSTTPSKYTMMAFHLCFMADK